MRQLRAAAGYRAPAERLAELRAELAEERDLARRLRVLAAVVRYAHPNPPLPAAAQRRVPAQREPDPGEMWPQRKGIRQPPARLRQPRGGRA